MHARILGGFCDGVGQRVYGAGVAPGVIVASARRQAPILRPCAPEAPGASQKPGPTSGQDIEEAAIHS